MQKCRIGDDFQKIWEIPSFGQFILLLTSAIDMKNFNALFRSSATALTAGLILLQSLTASAQCTNDLAIPSTLFGSGFNGNGNFNVIALGNYTAVTGTSEGRLAVGGNFTLNGSGQNFTVAVGADAPVTSDNFIVGGNYTNESGSVVSVRGNFYYGGVGGNFTTLPSVTAPGTLVNQSGRLDFTGMQQHYNTLSANYESQPATALPDPIVSGATLTLTGDNTVRNYVFNVNVTGNSITGINFVDIPAGSGILINVLNNFISLASGGSGMTATYRAKTLFNFPNATSIALNGFTIEGGILAPQSSLLAVSGTINGPVVIGGDIAQTGVLNFNNTCFSYPLPVKLAEFKVKKEGNAASLFWKTSAESNADRFVIERRNQRSNWETIGEVTATGDSEQMESYYHTDTRPFNGQNLYRLKMADYDGSYAYSSVVNVDFDMNIKAIAYPNPTADYITFSDSDWTKVAKVNVLNQKGKSIVNGITKAGKIDIRDLAGGLYLLQITSKDGQVSTQQFIKK
jgi:choice-of-anchor A domain-containing protein